MSSQDTLYAKSVLEQKRNYKVLLNILIGLIAIRVIIFYIMGIPSLLNADNTVGLILGILFFLIYTGVAVVWIFLLRKPYKWAYIVFIILFALSFLSSMKENAEGVKAVISIGGSLITSLICIILAYIIYRGIFPRKGKVNVQGVAGPQEPEKPKEE